MGFLGINFLNMKVENVFKSQVTKMTTFMEAPPSSCGRGCVFIVSTEVLPE